MKKGFFLAFFLTGIMCHSQKSSVVMQAGSGMSYFFESNDDNLNVKYSSTISTGVSWLYRPEDFYFDWNINMQYLSSLINGDNWENNIPLDGVINSLSVSLLLEKMTSNSRWNVGYAFGGGFTFESLIREKYLKVKEERSFLSVTIEPILSCKVSQRLTLRLSPKLLWFDPINSLGPNEEWTTAGEDLQVLFQMGLKVDL